MRYLEAHIAAGWARLEQLTILHIPVRDLHNYVGRGGVANSVWHHVISDLRTQGVLILIQMPPVDNKSPLMSPLSSSVGRRIKRWEEAEMCWRKSSRQIARACHTRVHLCTYPRSNSSILASWWRYYVISVNRSRAWPSTVPIVNLCDNSGCDWFLYPNYNRIQLWAAK